MSALISHSLPGFLSDLARSRDELPPATSHGERKREGVSLTPAGPLKLVRGYACESPSNVFEVMGWQYSYVLCRSSYPVPAPGLVRSTTQDLIGTITDALSRRILLLVNLLPALLSGVLFLLFAIRLPAQSVYGSIVGNITDSSGQAVLATVTLTNNRTGDRKTTQTASLGDYRFLDLLPGVYRVDVEQAGFKHLMRGPVIVEVGSAVRIDLTLQVGERTESVEVQATTPLLQTENASVGQVVEQRMVDEMPLNGRNVLNLVALVPGVVPQGGAMQNLTNQNLFAAGNFQIGGGTANQNGTYFDGAPVNVNYANLTALVPTQDTIQEFRVQTNDESAEYGRFTGGVISLASKSGSNDFHGSAYEFLRNKVLNANDFFSNAAGVPRAPFTQNQFGMNLGGPVRKDRLFFFAGYEGFRLRVGTPFQETVPTVAERSGDFSNLRDYSGNLIPIYNPFTTCGQYNNPPCNAAQSAGTQPLRQQFPGNIIPKSMINSASLALISEYALPNSPGQQFTAINNFNTSAATGGGNDQVNFRGDYNLSAAQRLFARYTRWSLNNLAYDPYRNETCFSAGQCAEGFVTNQGVLGYTFSVSPATILDLRASYLRFDYARLSPTTGYDFAQLGWPATTNSQAPFRAEPDLTVSGYNSGAATQIIARNNLYNLALSFTVVSGRHTLKFGGELRRLEFGSLQGGSGGTFNFDTLATSENPSAPGNTGNGFASFLLGTGASGSISLPSLTDGGMFYQAYYANDFFQVSKKLTLTLGLRWEVPGAWTERFNRLAVFDPSLQTPLAEASGLPIKGGLALVDTQNRPGPYLTTFHTNLFAPRTGLAYRLTNDTVARIGYGIFFIPADSYYFMSPFQNPVNNVVNTWNATTNGELSFNNLLNNAFPNGFTLAPGRDPSYQPYGTNVLAPLYSQPYGYTQQWNVTLEHEFQGSLAVEAAYVGLKGTHLPLQNVNLNQLPDQYFSLGTQLLQPVKNPFFGLIASGPLSGPTIPYGQLLRPYPQFLNVYDMGAFHGDSIYHSLQIKLQKRFAAGGTILAAYTWSKNISDTDSGTFWLESGFTPEPEDFTNLRGNRSLSATDTPQRFVLSYVLDAPFGKGKKFLSGRSGGIDRLVSGWGISGVTTLQSGFPLHFQDLSSELSAFGVAGDANLVPYGLDAPRPDVIASCDKTVSGSAQARIGEWFNTACFQPAAPFALGSESRVDSKIRQAGIANYDLAVFKNTYLTERFRLQFRTEFFNIFNRVQFGAPGEYVGIPGFGVVTSQANLPRLVQFSMRINY